MARSLSNASPETQAAAGMGHNAAEDLDQETFMRHVLNIERHRNGPVALAKEALKRAKKEEKRLKDLAKVDGVKLVPLEATLHLRQMEDQDQAQENAILQNQYNIWGGVVEGQQTSFNFEGTKTPGERAEYWEQRGFDDIRKGRLDPEGHVDDKGNKSPCALMPGTRPSYCPVEEFQAWARGAEKAQALNDEDAVKILGRNANTPIEQAAKEQKDKENPPAPPAAEKPKAKPPAKKKAEDKLAAAPAAGVA